jgi:hypothetical protein
VFDRFLCGWTIARELERGAALNEAGDQRRALVERAVLGLLAADHHPSEHKPSPGM